jgi:hypothetical protein
MADGGVGSSLVPWNSNPGIRIISRDPGPQTPDARPGNRQAASGDPDPADRRRWPTRGAVEKKMTKATYICRSAKQKVVTYFILFLFLFLFFIDFF